MILVVTKVYDPTADYVIKKMQERGVEHSRINLDQASDNGSIIIDPNSLEWTINTGEDIKITDQEICSIWLRRNPKPKVQHPNKEIARYINQEWRLLWRWWLDSLDRKKVIDPDSNLRRASNKVLQLKIATTLGLQTPRTIITNDGNAVRRLHKKDQSLIAKTLGGFGKPISEGKAAVIYTNRIDLETIRKESASIELAPIIFQDEIKKDHEIRATLIDNELLSCRIESQRSEKTRIDWRRYDFEKVRHEPTTLPKSIASKLIRMAKIFDIRFASFDLAVDQNGDYIFFEMNPNSQFVWIEKLSGLPITDRLIDLLLRIQ